MHYCWVVKNENNKQKKNSTKLPSTDIFIDDYYLSSIHLVNTNWEEHYSKIAPICGVIFVRSNFTSHNTIKYVCCTPVVKKDSKNQESIQSSTTPVP